MRFRLPENTVGWDQLGTRSETNPFSEQSEMCLKLYHITGCLKITISSYGFQVSFLEPRKNGDRERAFIYSKDGL